VTGRQSLLADRIALAIVERGPSPGSTLATVVAARKATVLRELRTNPRFEQLGYGRGSRWRLAGNRYDPGREPLGPNPNEVPGEVVADRLAAVERRLAELEQRFAETEALAP
jgi:hypothetical protein